VRVVGDSLAGAWQQDLSLGAAEPGPGVAALWARARITELLDAGRRGSDAETVRGQIVATAMTHHLVSPHTSLVAVDKTPARPSGEPLRREQVPSLLPQGQSAGAIFGFPGTATNSAMLLRSGSMTVVMALLLLLTMTLASRGRSGIPA
jgi:Ca-activated chloride channel family protein